MATFEDINDFCRLCKENCRIEGILKNTKQIWQLNGSSEIFERLGKVGLTLQRHDIKSCRICAICFRRIQRIEESLATLEKWKLSEEADSGEVTCANVKTEKLERQATPSKTPTKAKRINLSQSPNRPAKQTRTEVLIHYPSQERHAECPPSATGIVHNVTKGNWTTAANHIMKHEILAEKIKESVLTVLDNECKRLCQEHKKDFILWQCSPDELRAFSFAKMESDLQRQAPFLFSLLSTITNHSSLHTCAAASVALRGRNPSMSSFAYYVNSILQYGGAKKAVFQMLSKFGISTNYRNAVKKKGLMANVWRRTSADQN